MTRYLLLTICCLFFMFASAQPYYDLVQQARSRYSAKDYARSVPLFRQAFALSRTNPYDLIAGASAAAQAGDKATALRWLDWACTARYANSRRLESNRDLSGLHPEPKWLEITAKVKARSDSLERRYDLPLQQELLAIGQDDQQPRLASNKVAAKGGDNARELDSLSTIEVYNDSINGVKLTKLLSERGWIDEQMVGPDAANVVFLVIQHSQSLQFQLKYLPRIREAAEKNEALGSELALLEDRTAVRQAKRQIYGSQIYFDSSGKTYVAPLDDPLNVDHRRARRGLPPMAEYAKTFDIVWDPQAYAKQLPELDKLSHTW